MSEQACRFVLTERCHTHQDETGRYEDAVMCEQGLAALRAELERLDQKWRDYERNHILPCFDWASEIGFDLRNAIRQNPGRNSTDLLVAHLRATLTEQELVIGRLHGALVTAIELIEEAQAQWGGDHLWKKWGMDEELARVIAISSPEPKEA